MRLPPCRRRTPTEVSGYFEAHWELSPCAQYDALMRDLLCEGACLWGSVPPRTRTPVSALILHDRLGLEMPEDPFASYTLDEALHLAFRYGAGDTQSCLYWVLTNLTLRLNAVG